MASPRTGSSSLTVMSVNVRIPVDSGDASWESRRDLLGRVIADAHPDVVGTQELRAGPAQDLLDRLPGFAWFGRDRRGDHDDEHMGVFYRRERLELVAQGDFWLSDTPDAVASITWGNALPRMVTWGRFLDRAAGRELLFANTHFPYRPEDERARAQCAALIVRRLAELSGTADGAGALPVVLTGDFNTGPASAAYGILTAALGDVRTQAPHAGPESTFHGFHDNPGDRIDWILQRGLVPVYSESIITRDGAVWPTDHLPIVARLAWPD